MNMLKITLIIIIYKSIICWIIIVLITSSVASPVCQEGQSERTFLIFTFSSRFFFFPRFFLIFSLFPDFLANFSLLGVALCPPWPPSGQTTVNNIDCALMGYAILSHLSCEAHHLTCWYKYTFSLNTSNLTNQTNLEFIVFLKITLSLDWSAQMR